MNRRKKILFTYALVLFCCTIAVIVVVISVKYKDAEALVAHLPVNRIPGNGVYVRDLLQNKWKFYAAVPPPPVKDREENTKVIILGPKDIPDVVRKTILFQEDKQFGEHHGVDLPAVMRALINNFFSDSLQGASTITEQLVKHLVGKARKEDRTYAEKMWEMLVAYALESKYSKEEIFVAYCNMLPLHAEGGVIITGIGQGFKSYYNKNLPWARFPLSVRQHTLLRCLMLLRLRRRANWKERQRAITCSIACLQQASSSQKRQLPPRASQTE